MPDSENVVSDPDAPNYLDEEGPVRYPNIEVELIGRDGNAFAIIGAVQRGLRRARVPAAEIDKFRAEAMSGDYNNVLNTCLHWVDVQ